MRKRVLSYLFFSAVFYCLISFGVNSTLPDFKPKSYGSLQEKTLFYAENLDDFDLIFLGDSRTYCGIDPDLMDSLLGTQSYNLAHWANWFPTQYPQFKEIVKFVPANTTVVWTLGHQNFTLSTDDESLKTNFPIRVGDVPKYLEWGFRFSSLKDNLRNHAHDNLRFVYPSSRSVSAFRNKLAGRFYSNQQEPQIANRKEESKNSVLANQLIQELQGKEGVCDIEVLVNDQNVTTSIVVQRCNGNYTRIELELDFFRKKQKEFSANILNDWNKNKPNVPFASDPRYWQNFLAILELFRENNIKLIVNEIEEAPNAFGHSQEIRQYYLSFMRNEVKPLVESMGFQYIKASFELLKDTDYFDYNHLNSQGIIKYDSMLAELLQPYLTE